MNVRDTLFLKLKLHPGVYPTKLRALEHLFLVSGNGYSWNVKTGELCAEIYSVRNRQKSLEAGPYVEALARGIARNRELEKGFPKTFKREQSFPERDDDEVERMLAEPLDPQAAVNCKGECVLYSAYPLYAALSQFPNTVTTDWAAAIYDFAGFCLALRCGAVSQIHETASLALSKLHELK